MMKGMALAGFVLAMTAWAGADADAGTIAAKSFDIRFSLSPKAAAKLGGAHEVLTFSWYYYGDPKPGYERKANPVGQIEMGADKLTADPRDQTINIGDRALRRDRFGWIVDRKAFVNVNVFSARRVFKDNLLDCGFLDLELDTAVAAPQAIACKLIGET